MANREREIKRIEKLKKTKAEFLEMLGNDSPNYFQKEILHNIDATIFEKESLIKS